MDLVSTLETLNRELGRASVALIRCAVAADYVRTALENEYGIEVLPEQFQALTSTLFIHVDRQQLIGTLPLRLPPNPKKPAEPQQPDNDLPPCP